eukprot:TRINITY_DN25601_c0_g1_i1.p1 TRINITY_DN25601_c0_g1~~TRINITY_DN25601_c0_g1_i1.p1  ORF type:complete len:232 (+),score=69.45 TRINITY_DN25601_c0_g1_i1:82-696(+)
MAPKLGKKKVKKGAEKASPKSSPKTSPKIAPNKPGKAAPRGRPSEAEKKEMTTKAVALITATLKSKEAKEVQEKGHPMIPKEWPLEYKPVLGGYRKFVESCSAFTVASGDQPAKYTVHLAEGGGPVKVATKYQEFLQKAWQSFCTSREKGNRDVKEFLALAEAAATSTGTGGNKQAEKRKKDQQKKNTKAKKSKVEADDNDDDE